MVNRVVLVGRLVRDPELRRTQTNQAVTSFTIAVDNRGREKSASFLPVVCWGQTAEFVAQYLKKGNLVGVDGRLQQRSYENQAKQKVNIVEIVADSVQALESKGSEGSAQGGYEPDTTPDPVGVDVSDDDLPF
ncbi:MAG: single-stranded DNA-binding protein [Bacilli bacterium]|nr:single-stranded DNA-binding protein [Bacilli bacterium]